MRDHLTAKPSWVPDWSVKRITNLIYNSFACGSSASDAEYTREGNLRVLGVKAATIKVADKIQLHGLTRRDVVAAVRQCIPPGVNRNSGELFEKYCRTICCDYFRDRYNPPMSHFPSWDESQEVLSLFLRQHGDVNFEEPLDLGADSYLGRVLGCIKNRSFISTEEGRIGLGPLLTKAGDEVVVFPGCPSPMVLRSTDDGRYQVVGGCFILGLMDGEALLGPFPEGYKCIMKLNTDNNSWYTAYRDCRTDQVQWTDPRFNFFRSEMQENGIRKVFARGSEIESEIVSNGCGIRMWTSRLSFAEEEVIVMGVDLKTFELK
jgi:hypothetical protein